jgi:hypothetical protein
VHAELVAKATFLTSIMDEIPLTPRDDLIPPLGPVAADRRKVFRSPEFAIREPASEPKPPEPPSPTPAKAETDAGGLASPGSPVPAS